MGLHKTAIHKSCSNCRRRKIKCDKSERLQNAPDGDEVVCSPCSSAKLRCENEVVQPRKTNGKRLREIRKEQELERLESDQKNDKGKKVIRTNQIQQISTSKLASTSSTLLDSSGCLSYPDQAVANRSSLDPNSPSTSSFNNNRTTVSHLSSERQPELLVPGLTRPLLEACVAQFFISVSPTQPVCRPDHFYPRYRSFLERQSPSTSTLASSTSLPVSPSNSELSILAVACIGAGHLDLSSTSGGVVEKELERKFELRAALYRALKIKLHANGGAIVKKDPMDAIEACYLMYTIESDLNQSGLLPTTDPDITDLSQSGLLPNTNPDPREDSVLSIKPMTLPGCIKLLYDHGFNRKPRPDVPIHEQMRHTRLFWACLISDSFHSLATRKDLLVSEDSFDLDLPKWIPFSSPVPGIPESQTSRIASHGSWSDQHKFEMQWVASVLRLSFIVRDLNRPFVSTRAQSRGIHPKEVMKAIDLLRRYWDERPRELIFDTESQQRFLSTKDLRDNQIWRNRMKSVFLECLFHATVYSLYFCLNDFGFYNLQDGTPIEILAHSTSQFESKTSLESFTLESYERLLSILPTTASEGMIRASTSVVIPTILCTALFGCEKAEKAVKSGLESQETEKDLRDVEMTIECLATADSSQTTPALVTVAKCAAIKARQTLEAREQEKANQSSTVEEETLGSSNQVTDEYDIEAGRLFAIEERRGEASGRSGLGSVDEENGTVTWSPEDLPEFLSTENFISSDNSDAAVPVWLTSFSGFSSASSSFQGVFNEFPQADSFDVSGIQQPHTGPVHWNEGLDDALFNLVGK